MKLNVPLIRQTAGTQECALAGLAMIFSYYGEDVPYEQIQKDIPLDKVGSYAPQFGAYLIKHGFDVALITMHPALFLLKEEGMSQEDVHKRLLERKADTNEQNLKVINYYLDFMNQGGVIVVKRPDIDDLISEIKQSRPVGANLTSNILNGSKPGVNFHFNLVIGADKQTVTVLDPASNEQGGEASYASEDFFFALYASMLGDLDNACLMCVKPREENSSSE